MAIQVFGDISERSDVRQKPAAITAREDLTGPLQKRARSGVRTNQIT